MAKKKAGRTGGAKRLSGGHGRGWRKKAFEELPGGPDQAIADPGTELAEQEGFSESSVGLLEYLVECCQAHLEGKDVPSLLPKSAARPQVAYLRLSSAWVVRCVPRRHCAQSRHQGGQDERKTVVGHSDRCLLGVANESFP